jgi:hypothetical protein
LGRLKHLLLLSLLIISQQIIVAQQPISSNEGQYISMDETVFIHSNATTFVSGETIYYKLYCLSASDKTPSKISKVAYVELIDSDKKNVFKHKLFLENAIGEGDFFVPTTLSTGNYKLIGYTNWMLNEAVSEIFQIDVVIINPFQSNDGKSINTIADSIYSKSESKQNSQNSRTINSAKNDNLKFKLNKKIFSNREEVKLQIEALNQIPIKGNYSLSVRKVDDLSFGRQMTTSVFAKKPSATKASLLDNEKKLILPELRGEMISGKIISKNDPDDVQNITVALSIPGKSFAFKVIKTDVSGNFIFNLEKAYYNSSVIIQIIDDNRDQYTITLDDIPKIDYAKVSIQSDFNLAPELKKTIENRSVMSQVENAYHYLKTDSIIKPKEYKSFFYPTAKEYILDDYTRFATLKETIIEVTKEVYYQEKDQNYSLHVTNYNVYPQLPESALVLVDGLLLQNVNELFDYRMKNVYKISVIAGPYFFGSKVFNGLISIATINNDYPRKGNDNSFLETTNLRPSVKKKYYKTNYADKIRSERIPDYRNQLLWIPEISLGKDYSQFSFFTSDESGTFEIIMEGFTDEGIPVSLRESIEVN